MISRREKLQLFNKLRGEGHAEADLSLLEDANPRNPKLTRFARDPKRYADEILYALLDECDEEDIVDHRISFEKLNENIVDAPADDKQIPDDGSSNTSADDKQIPDDGSSNTSADDKQIPDDGSSNTSDDDKQIPDDGSSDTSAEGKQISDDDSSNTSTEEENPEGENQQESEQPDSADPVEDSKKK